jgi:hypothetical protein
LAFLAGAWDCCRADRILRRAGITDGVAKGTADDAVVGSNRSIVAACQV